MFACVAVAGAAEGPRGVPPDFTRLDPTPFESGGAPTSSRTRDSMRSVPAGDYTFGREDGPPGESPAHSIGLRAFEIDRTEVTNAAFAEYLNALGLAVAEPFEAGAASPSAMTAEHAALLTEGPEGSGLYPIIALDDEQARIGFTREGFAPTPGYEDHPVTETTWAGARAYCAWRGARLPSEAEWEAAARGIGATLYPWGDDPPDRTRVLSSGRTGVTAPVGGRPAGATPEGVLDMSGSLAEWTSSLLRPYPYDANDGREAPERSGERVTRGGDYLYDAVPATLTATHRDGFSNAPGRGHRHIGFRCAASGS